MKNALFLFASVYRSYQLLRSKNAHFRWSNGLCQLSAIWRELALLYFCAITKVRTKCGDLALTDLYWRGWWWWRGRSSRFQKATPALALAHTLHYNGKKVNCYLDQPRRSFTCSKFESEKCYPIKLLVETFYCTNVQVWTLTRYFSVQSLICLIDP